MCLHDFSCQPYVRLLNLSFLNPRRFLRLVPDDPDTHLLIRLLYRRS
jgi:hypothetical protein